MAPLAEAFVRVRAQVDDVQRDVSRTFRRAGSQAGQEFGEGFSRDSNGRLHDQYGRFVREAGEAGGEAGDRFGGGFTRAMSAGMAGAARSMRGLQAGTSAGSKAVLGLGAASAGVFAGMGAGIAGVAAGIGALGIKLALSNDELKKTFEDTFKGIQKEAQALATPFIGPLKQVAGIIKSTFAAIGPALGNAFKTLAPALVPLAQGISQMVKTLSTVFQPIAEVGAKILSGLGPALAQLGTQLVAFLKPILAALNQVGAGLFGTLINGFGQILVSLAPLIATMIQVGSTLLGPLLGAINTIVGALAQALIPVIKAIAPVFVQLVGAIAPLVSQLVSGLSPILVALAPILSNIFAVLQPVISALISALQPVIAALVPVVGLLVNALGRIILAVVPLLQPLGQLIASLVNGLMPVLTPIISLIAQTAATIIGALVQALIQCMPALQQIILSIAQLLPLLTPLIPMWGQLVTAIIPLIPMVVNLAAMLIGYLVPVLRLVITVFVKIATTVMTWLLPVLQKLVSVIGWVASLIQPALTGIGVAIRWLGTTAMWLWTAAIAPAFRGIAAAATWLWTTVIVPVFNGIRAAIAASWGIIRPIFSAIAGAARAVVGVAFTVLSNVVKTAWILIQVAIKVAWTVIRAIFTAIRTYINAVLAPVFRWLLNNVIKPVWSGIRSAISVAWTLIRGTWNGIKNFLSVTLGPAFRTFRTVASGAWSGLRSAISTVYTSGIKPVFDRLRGALSTVKSAFSTAVGAIKTSWDKLKSIAKAPVNFVIGVYNKGIVGLVNKLADFAGVKTRLSAIPQLAAGGTLANPARMAPMMTRGPMAIVGEGRPAHPEFVIPTDPKYRSRAQGLWAAAGKHLGADAGPDRKWLSGRNRLGGEGMAFRRGGSLQAMAMGGIIGDFVEGVRNFTVGNVEKGARTLLDKVLGGTVPGSGVFRTVVAAIPGWIKDKLLGWIKSKVMSFGGGPGFERGLAWAKTQDGKPYQWGGNGNPSWDCSGFMSAIESVIRGQRPHRRWSTHPFHGGASSPMPGWHKNLRSGFMIGVTGAGVGHTAGTLLGKPVESGGSGGVQVGGGARGHSNSLFNHRYGLRLARGGVVGGVRTATYDSGGWLQPGYTLAYNGTGKPEPVVSLAKGGVLKPARSPFGGGLKPAKSPFGGSPLVPGSAPFPKAVVDAFKALRSQIDSTLLKSVDKLNTFFKSLNASIVKTMSGNTEKRMLAWSKTMQTAMLAAATRAGEISSKIAKAKEFATSVADSAREFGSLSNLPKGGTATDTLAGLQVRAASLKEFASQITQLRARGLSSSLLSQVIGMGAGQGRSLAASLLAADPKTFAGINAAQQAVEQAATGLGQNAANAMFDGGRMAGRGFLSGLLAQQAELNKLMDSLGRRLTAGLMPPKGAKAPPKRTPSKRAPSRLTPARGVLYDSGGWLPPGIPHNKTGKPEPVFTAAQWKSIHTLAQRGARSVPAVGELHVHGLPDIPSDQQIAAAIDRTLIMHGDW
ncbi:hypothetical protein ACFVH6_21860 [Spirillospora sp. NPDC127200]